MTNILRLILILGTIFVSINEVANACRSRETGECLEEGGECKIGGFNGQCSTLGGDTKSCTCNPITEVKRNEVCDSTETIIHFPITPERSGSGVYAEIQATNTLSDEGNEWGAKVEIGISFGFELTRSEYVSISNGLLIKNLSANDIHALSGLAIVDLPSDVVVEAVRFRSSNKPIVMDNRIIDAVLETSAKTVPGLKDKIGSSPVVLVNSDDPANLPLPVGSDLYIDFIFILKVLLKEDNFPLFPFSIIPIFIDNNMQYKIGNLWKFRLKAFDVANPSNTLKLTDLLEETTKCKKIVADLPVKLISFQSAANGKDTEFRWETGTEIDNIGFNIWCAQLQNNQFNEITKLNSQLIPSKAILPNYGVSYSSEDYPWIDTNLKPGIQHCTLEDLDANGQCTLHCDEMSTVVIGNGNNISATELNELNAKAIVFCNEYKPDGVCLEQFLDPNQ